MRIQNLKQSQGNYVRNCGAQRDVREGWTRGLWGQGRAWLRCPWVAAGPGVKFRTAARRHWREGRRRVRRAWLRCPWAAGPGRASRQRVKQAPQVWRAPEGPEGTGGLRGAAPNEVRPPSLAGGRALRRPKHPRGHKQQTTATGTTKRAGTPRFRPALNAQWRSAARDARRQRARRVSSAQGASAARKARQQRARRVSSAQGASAAHDARQ